MPIDARSAWPTPRLRVPTTWIGARASWRTTSWPRAEHRNGQGPAPDAGTDEGRRRFEDGPEDAHIAEPGLAAGRGAASLDGGEWRAEVAPETSLFIGANGRRLEVVQQRQVDFVDGHAAIPPRAH